MPLSASLVGRTYPEQRDEVTAVKVAELRAATDAPAPSGADGPAVAPPTFVMTAVFAAMESVLSDLDVELSHVVHADQRFTYQRAVRVGDVLVTTPTILSVRAVAGNDLVGLGCTIVDGSGGTVCETRTTLLVRTPDPAPTSAAGAVG